jgi:PTS system ascorbate-specific IIA component
MTIGVLIITHENIGQALLETATQMMGVCPVATEVLAIPLDCDCDRLYLLACQMLERINDGSGVIVLTDMFGGTPANIANRLAENHKVEVISGVNLPMVVRILNYATLDLHEVALKARDGGCDGIFICGEERV